MRNGFSDLSDSVAGLSLVGWPLDEVDWADQPSGCAVSKQHTRASTEARVLQVRKSLQTKSDLGEYGAEAIHRELERRQDSRLPSVRTIGRVLERHGALDGRRRLRHTSPPRGWYLPRVAACTIELDSFDDYRIVLTTKPGRPNVDGLIATTLRSTDGFVRQSLGTTIDGNGLKSGTAYWRAVK